MMIWLVQLVFDCADPDAVARFWGRALDYRNALVWATEDEVRSFRAEHPQFDGRGRIDDEELRRMPVYIQRVPEPKQGRNRVRLEVGCPAALHAATIERLAQLGATASSAADEYHDGEGNEFTVVTTNDPDELRLRSIVIDSIDPERMARFWADATGCDRSGLRCDPASVPLTWDGSAFELHGQRLLHITGAGGSPGPARYDLVPGFAFVEVNEPKTTKNRLHVDLNSTEPETDRERLVALGATVLRWDTDHVLADPEGNEFCLSGRFA